MSIKDLEPLLNHLSDVFPPSTSGINPWSWLAAITFSVLNHPEAVPIIFQYALNKVTTQEDRLLLARKFRESMVISSVSGIPQMINSFFSLSDVMPEDLEEKSTMRRMDMSVAELFQIGQERFDQIYGSTADSIGANLRKAYPDLETYILLFYGYCINVGVVNGIPTFNANEVSYAIIVSLIANHVPRQVGWHLNNALRNGAPMEEIKAVQEIASKVAEFCGVDRTVELPVDMNVLDKYAE